MKSVEVTVNTSDLERLSHDLEEGSYWEPVADEIEDDCEHWGTGWPTSRVRDAVEVKYDADELDIFFTSRRATNQSQVDGVGRGFQKLMADNMPKYINKINNFLDKAE